MTGALTATMVGEAAVGSAALKTLIDSVDCGAATRGAEITSMELVYVGNGQISVIKYARAA